ncbi:MAG: Hsp20/alpha crystallin family protein [Candidatus Bathyarchaeia archaeon]
MAEKVVTPPHMFACLDAEGENYIVEVELPGVKKKDIDLSMHEDIIHVLAEREDLAFHGHLHFPIKVNPKKAKAKFTSGLLRVEVPLKEKRKPPTKIEVK